MRRVVARRLATTVVAVATMVPLALAAPPVQAAAPRAAVPAAAPAGEHGSPLSPVMRARLDRLIEHTRQELGVPGVTVGLWFAGQGRYVKSFGVADTATGQRMRPGLNMRIGSETKTFTATAVLELVDQKRVGLDVPIARYLRGVPDGAHITVRQLLEMRSGLFPYSADPGFIKTFLGDPTRQFTPHELLTYGYRHTNVFAPGTQFQYSNTNYVLLGLLVEKLSRMPLAEYIQRHVIEPSHLDRTLFPFAAELPRPYAHGYTNQTPSGAVADATHWNPSAAWAAGAMISTLEDMRRWAKDVATGSLLSPATQAEREKFISPPGVTGAGYGLGLFDVNGWIGHNGSIPGYESVTVYLPQECATMVILLNTDIMHNGSEPSTVFAEAITSLVTPDHIYRLPAAAAG